MSSNQSTEVIVLTKHPDKFEEASRGGKPRIGFECFLRLIAYIDFEIKISNKTIYERPVRIFLDNSSLKGLKKEMAVTMLKLRAPGAKIDFFPPEHKVSVKKTSFIKIK
jgi:hypothetical protein